MHKTKQLCKRILSMVLALMLTLNLASFMTITASAAGVVPYDFAIATNGIFKGTVHNVGNATQKVDKYFLLDSADSTGGFTITFEMTTNNTFYSQFCVTGFAGVVGQYNRNAIEIVGEDEGWTITYPKDVFDHHTKQTITLKANERVRGVRTIKIPIRDYQQGYGAQNIDFLMIPVLFYDGSVTASDIQKGISWTSGTSGTNGGTLSYPTSSPADATLWANWDFASNKYMSATYQWYKENNGQFVAISGATEKNYKPNGEGKYKVDISLAVQEGKLAGIPGGTYKTSATATVVKADTYTYFGIDRTSGHDVTKTIGDTYQFVGMTHVPGVFVVKSANYQYTFNSNANGNSTNFSTGNITATLEQSGTYEWSFTPTNSDYLKASSGTVKLTVNPKASQAKVSLAAIVTGTDLSTGQITIQAATPGVFKITTQGITKNYTYSASNVGKDIVIPETDFFGNPIMGEATLDYEFTPDQTPDYRQETGTINYKYTNDSVVKIVQEKGGTITVNEKSDSTQVLPIGDYNIVVTPVASSSTQQSAVQDILINGTKLPESVLKRNANGTVTATLHVTKRDIYTVSATYDYKKLSVKQNATVYVDAGASLAEINKAIFDAVVDKSNTYGISAEDIYTLYYQGYHEPFMGSAGYDVWETPEKIVYIAIFITNAHTFGTYSANSYKESLKISVPGTGINTQVTVNAYRRSTSIITTNSEKIVISENEYSYDNTIHKIGAQLNGAASNDLQYVLANGQNFSSAWQTKQAGEEFTITVKYAGATNGAGSAGSAEKTVTVYIRPDAQITPDKIEMVYTGSQIQLTANDFTAVPAQGKGFAMTVQSMAYYDASKAPMNSTPKDAGDYYIKLGLSDEYGTFESDYVPLKIKAAENAWVTSPAINNWIYGETPSTPISGAKFGSVNVKYTGIANDNTTWNSTTAPEKAGNYVATFTVDATNNYGGLSENVPFVIEKATYDMSGAKWNYTKAFAYDGKEHSVEVSGLPTGVIASKYEENKATTVGSYTAKVTLQYDNYNYNTPNIASLAWAIENNWLPVLNREYSVSIPNHNGWLNQKFEIKAAQGYLLSRGNGAGDVWEETLAGTTEGADSGITFYVRNMSDDTISLAKVEKYKLDTMEPTGKVYFDEHTFWEEFIHTITFGLFYKEEVTVKVESADALSGVESVEYITSDHNFTLDEVKAQIDWKAMPANGIPVDLEDAKQFVYYVRIIDKAGNVTYLSTDGAEYDTTAPIISGVEHDGIYHTTQKIVVTDKNLATVTLNGQSATDTIVLEGDKTAVYTIIATDKAGNATTVTVTTKPITDIDSALDGVTENNVKSTDKETLQDVIEKVDGLLGDDGLVEKEKTALEEIKENAETLLDKIDEVAKEITTDNIDKIKDVTEDNVKPADKTNLEIAKAELEKALKENGDNYTDGEKKAIRDEIRRIENALKAIEELAAKRSPATGEQAKISTIMVVLLGCLVSLFITFLRNKKRTITSK